MKIYGVQSTARFDAASKFPNSSETNWKFIERLSREIMEKSWPRPLKFSHRLNTIQKFAALVRFKYQSLSTARVCKSRKISRFVPFGNFWRGLLKFIRKMLLFYSGNRCEFWSFRSVDDCVQRTRREFRFWKFNISMIFYIVINKKNRFHPICIFCTNIKFTRKTYFALDNNLKKCVSLVSLKLYENFIPYIKNLCSHILYLRRYFYAYGKKNNTPHKAIKFIAILIFMLAKYMYITYKHLCSISKGSRFFCMFILALYYARKNNLTNVRFGGNEETSREKKNRNKKSARFKSPI